MKKRLLSVLLTLCLLLGLVPTAALAAETPVPSEAIAAMEEPAQPMAPTAETDPPATLSAITVSPVITLADANDCRYYQGPRLTSWTPSNAGRGTYEGGVATATNSGASAALNLKEGAHYKDASYLLQPFTLSVEVPARTSYQVKFRSEIRVNRNALGLTAYFAQMANNTDNAAYGKAFDTDLPTTTTKLFTDYSPVSVGNYWRWVTNGDRSGEGRPFLVVFDNSAGATAKTVSIPYALALGADAAASADVKYHHQLDVSLTLKVEEVSIVNVITYEYKRQYGSDTVTDTVTSSESSTTLADAPYEKKGCTFSWKDKNSGAVYPAGYTYSGGNLQLVGQWESSGYTVTLDPQGGAVSSIHYPVTYGEAYGDLPTPTREGYTFIGWYTDTNHRTRILNTTTVTATDDHTLYAYWGRSKVAVTFDKNAGGGGNTTRNVDQGSAVGDLPTVTRSGYTFDGWFTEPTGGTKISKTTTVNAATTYYAHWTPKSNIKVGFDANYTDAPALSDQLTVTYGQPYGALPTVTRTGHSFLGWYTAAVGGTQVESGVTAVATGSDHTLYAKWKAGTVAVTLDPGEGSVATDSLTVKYGNKYLSLPTPTREGYTFDGWYTQATGGDKVDQFTVVTSTAPTQTLYAHWTEKTYTYPVYLESIGGVCASTHQVTSNRTYGEHGDLPTPTRTGYTFLGWFTQAEGGDKVENDTLVTKIGSHHIYAHWAKGTYTVTFDAKGGEVSETSRQIPYGDCVGALPEPTRENYSFLGWYTAAEGGNRISQYTAVKDNATYYAHWSANTYSIKFNYNGGSPVGSGDTLRQVLQNGPVGTLPAATRTGYDFVGWFTEKDGGTEVTATTQVTGNVNYHAHWTAKTMTVTLDANGGTLDGETTKTVTYGQSYGELPTPTAPDGKVFVGWQSADGSPVSKSTLVQAEENHTLTAQWADGHFHKVGSDGTEVQFTAASSSSAAASGGSYYLTADDTSLTIPTGATATLCLNGHSAGNITVKAGGTLSLCDCAGGGGARSITNNGGTVNMYGGTIQDSTPIKNNSGTFNLYGGTVYSNKTSTSGSGIGIQNTGTLNVYGGSVTGDVYGIQNGGTLTLSGDPVISGATADIDLAADKTIALDSNFAPAGSYSVQMANTLPYTFATGGNESNVANFATIGTDVGVRFRDDGLQIYSHHSHPLCGADCDHGPEAHGQEVEYSPLTVNRGTTLASGSYYLAKNPSAGITISAGATVDLCLNGYTVTSPITVGSGGTLNLCDCVGSGSVACTAESTSNATAIKNNGGTVNVYSGTITANNSKSNAAGIAVSNGGTVNVYGGTVSGTSTKTGSGSGSGFGIYTSDTSATNINVYGGTVSGTCAGGSSSYSNPFIGCGIGDDFNLSSEGTIKVYGGTVSGASTYTGTSYSKGYGIKNPQGGTADISGGAVTGSTYGVESNGTTNISGGVVSGEKNCGIHIYRGITTVTDGLITSAASYGIHIDGATLTVTGGTITSTSTGTTGSGIYNSGTLTLGGAPTISGPISDLYLNYALTAQSDLNGIYSVTTYKTPNASTPVSITKAASEDQSVHFTSAKADYVIRNSGTGDSQVVQLCLSQGSQEPGDEDVSHKHSDNVVFDAPLTQGGELASGGHYLTGALTADLTVPAGATVDLCLNGSTLTGALTVNGILNIYDCSAGKTGKVVSSAIGGSGVLNLFGGALEGSADNAPLTVGAVNFHTTPNISKFQIAGSQEGFLHIGQPLTQPNKPYTVSFQPGVADVDITQKKQLTLTDAWKDQMNGADPADYFAPPSGVYAKIATGDDGEAVLRLYQVTVGGAVCYPDPTTGKLTEGELARPAARPGYIWQGWFNAETGGTEVTKDTVFTDDMTLYPRWTACDHIGNTAQKTATATCTQAGTETFTCSVCALAVETALDPLGHDVAETWENDDPDVHYHTCTRCDARDSATAAAHTWNAGTVTKEPTVSAQGERTHTCTVCGATETETLPMLPTYSVTYTLDDYTRGDAPTQAAVAEGAAITLPSGGLTRTGYTLAGWALLDEAGLPGEDTLTGSFAMVDRNVTFQVRWTPVADYPLQSGETIVMEDGAVVKKEGDTVTIDQDGDGVADTTVTLPAGTSSVTVQQSDSEKPGKLVLPAQTTVQTGSGPVITIGNGGGKVNTLGCVEGSVGSSVAMDDSTVTITEGSGSITPSGNMVFPEGGDGKVTVTKNGESTEVTVPGGGEGIEPSGTVPTPIDPAKPNDVVLPSGIKVTLPNGGGVTINDDGSNNVPGGSVITKPDGTTVDVPENGGKVTSDGSVSPLDQPVHTHSWASGWARNTTHHWHECQGAGTCTVTQNSGKDGYNAHVYDDDQDASCNTCGYTRTVTPSHTHSLTKVSGQGATCTAVGWKDYYSCACGKVFADAAGNTEITDLTAWKAGDGKVDTLAHDFSGDYLSDAEGHWHKCKNCTATDTKAAHVYDDDADTTCNDCGYTRTVTPPAPTYSITGAVTENNAAVSDAAVKLVRGKDEIDSATTDSEGNYVFSNVAPGSYNVVATKDGKTMTILVTVTGSDLTEQNLVMPSDKVNSVLDVKETTVTNAAADVTKTVVGGLEAEAQENKEENSTVTVTMTVEAKAEGDAPNAPDIKAEAGADKTLEYIEITVEKTVETDGTAADPIAITTTHDLLTVVIPFNFTGKNKDSVTVYRYHEGSVDTLTATPNGEGEHIILGQDSITLKVKNFSTYAIGYTEVADEPTPGPSSGGSHSSVYTPTLQQPDHGKITVSPARPKAGDTVTITVTPEEGYGVEGVTVTDKNGKAVEVTHNSDGTYSFTQPSGRVTISATISEIPVVCPKDNTCPIAKFTDAKATAWYHDGVHYCLEEGLMVGTSETTFAPAMETSRAMIATILWRLNGSPTPKARIADFPDVVDGSWYADAVRWCAEQEIVLGYDNGNFGPEDTITREQLATMLYRYEQKINGGGFTGSWMFLLDFADAADVSQWADEAMHYMSMHGVITGKDDDVLDPQGQATRAEAATMLFRFLQPEEM